ncbi:PD-(D/E)XK nuclease family protein [Yimella sp. RIT 621]|uniref:PD-(D/E)XK nuclease family protein n=1 Tax=Yimella sp. RIT 621 TaxID=2510323 RepID=UPI001459FBEA|nr:PD-(D/E)XK nuclease family protein [Yimella sp. RIT 621]
MAQSGDSAQSAVDAQSAFDSVLAEWRGVADDDAETRFGQLLDEWSAFEWQSGSRTLLTALGLQHQEVPLCRGLAWLLDPTGGHHLDRAALNAFLHYIGQPVTASDDEVKIQVEEIRENTRADIVLNLGARTIVVEAKVHAGEQPTQADRLAALWGEHSPTLVFLTTNGYAPYTAVDSKESWVPCRWRDLAAAIRQAIAEQGLEASAGARDFLETIGAL